MDDASSQNRAKSRYLAGLTATVHVGDRAVECRAVDLNRDGVMLAGGIDPEERPEVTVTLASVRDDLRLVAVGRVAYFAAAGEENRLGLHFESLDDEQRDTLESLVARVLEGMDPAPLARLPRDASVEEVQRALAEIPVAHRIAIARRAAPVARRHLRHDDNPQVLEALARNPQITQPEIVLLLRIPTLLPTTLEVLARDGHWTASEEMKIAIATHPRVPFSVAERLVRTLSIVGIRRIIRRPGLNPALKSKLVKSVSDKQLEGW